MRIGILFGGNSQEHDISIITAYQIKKKMDKDYDVSFIYIDNLNQIYLADKMKLDDFKSNNLKKLKKSNFVMHGVKGNYLDCIILAVHGENVEDGSMAALCRFYHIPYVGSDVLASSISLDKYRCYKMLKGNGIAMLDTILYTYADYLAGRKIDIFPCILKPLYGGSSIGINVCNTYADFDRTIIKSLEYSKELVIQPFYKNIEEYNLAIYENGVSRLERIDLKNDFFTFDDKYNSEFKLMHRSMCDDSLFAKFKDIGRNVYNILNASGIIRIDFFMIDDVIYVNEVNIIPGGLAMYLFDDFNRVIKECIDLAVSKQIKVYDKLKFLANSNINK